MDFKMKKEDKSFGVAGVSFLLFLLLTAAFQHVDVRQIGPRGSSVGFAILGLTQLVKRRSLLKVDKRILNNRIKIAVKSVMVVFTVFMVVGRMVSGVHWLTDIIGSILLSVAFVSLYRAISKV